MAKTKQLTVSYSEISAARRCSLKHELTYVDGWTKEKPPESALAFGTAWHSVLNAYYTELKNVHPGSMSSEILHSPWREACKIIDKGEYTDDTRERLRWMLEGYAATYGVEPTWRVVATEQTLIVPLPKVGPWDINLKVYIDLIMKDSNGNLWVDDHKTCAQFPSPKARTDSQLPLYMYAILVAGGWPPPFGARYSYALKPPKVKRDHPLEKRFRRRQIHHTEREVMEAAKDAYRTVYARYTEQERVDGTLDRSPRTPQDDCAYRCDFDVPCRASSKGYKIDSFLKDHGFGKWRDTPKAPEDPSDEAA